MCGTGWPWCRRLLVAIRDRGSEGAQGPHHSPLTPFSALSPTASGSPWPCVPLCHLLGAVYNSSLLLAPTGTQRSLARPGCPTGHGWHGQDIPWGTGHGWHGQDIPWGTGHGWHGHMSPWDTGHSWYIHSVPQGTAPGSLPPPGRGPRAQPPCPAPSLQIFGTGRFLSMELPKPCRAPKPVIGHFWAMILGSRAGWWPSDHSQVPPSLAGAGATPSVPPTARVPLWGHFPLSVPAVVGTGTAQPPPACPPLPHPLSLRGVQLAQ